ncbi:adenosylmethionine-8-amino-7-oxononanoate aminotransferase/dethiobiotin synthetase [Mariprofundus ferrinatatus]|uniref:ATP-dependent dethiobiotin synthetase BioD n=1 Tax=Mariprofundus ferrinatatus TaxID=1921087 RepID=A0A2K8L4X1_9PROT|nr:dethiobiotin synthase [Mariprofundus ferrinatatus]ATX80891.1 adenosylmethionine-8-amino-7-oxononanoate aminotransferase/dethiobiotin synthetase [Mariprofundus ferrinatatus]
MASKRVFISATDTEAGKTWVTASAIRALLKEGNRAIALKPVACGLDDHGRNEDIDALLAAQGLTDPDQISLYRYALPAAPSQAAAAEGATIDADKLVEWCESQSADVDTCLIEGVGGLMVPITDSWLVSGWVEAMPDAEIWLVVGCKLGAINQTLLTLEKLKQMGRTPSRIFFNATKAEQNDWLNPTLRSVKPFLNKHCEVHTLKFTEEVALGS